MVCLNKTKIGLIAVPLLILFVLCFDSDFTPVYAAAAHGGSKSDADWQYSARLIQELKDKYPLADAVILRHEVDIQMDERGLVNRRILRRVALFTDNAIRRYADPRILFNSAAQELEVSIARVYMRDGTVVDSGGHAFNQTTPFAFAHAPDYTDWQELVVTHLGIEKDCVAELVYTISDKKQMKPWLSGVEHLAHDDPALVSELAITVPPGRRLKYHLSAGAPAPTESAHGTYYWTLANTPCIPPVDGGIWRGESHASVIYSTANDWDEVSGYIAELFERCAAPAAQQTEDAGESEDAILERLKECVKSVRSIEAPFRMFDSPPRNAERIHQTAYSHALDEAILLSAKLNEIGVASTPVLVSAGRSWSKHTPAPELFSRILLEVVPSDSKGTLLLDARLEHPCDAKSVFAGRTMMKCGKKAEIIHIAQAKPEDNISSLQVTLTLGDDGKLSGDGSVTMQGAFSPYYSIRGLENETEEYMKKKVEALLPTAKLESWNLKSLQRERVDAGFEFMAEMPKASKNDRVYLIMPRPFSEEISRINRVHVERSEYPVPLRAVPCHMKVTLFVENIKDYLLAEKPFHVEEQNGVGRVIRSVKTSMQEEGMRITFSNELIIEKEVIASEEYGLLRSLLIKFLGEPVILRMKGGE